MSESPCDICRGTGKNSFNEVCPYCNGTGEWNDMAVAYMKNHTCQCIVLDRKFCPICEKKCHHDTESSPKQVIDSGYGGMTQSISVTSTESVTTIQQEEELIVS